MTSYRGINSVTGWRSMYMKLAHVDLQKTFARLTCFLVQDFTCITFFLPSLNRTLRKKLSWPCIKYFDGRNFRKFLIKVSWACVSDIRTTWRIKSKTRRLYFISLFISPIGSTRKENNKSKKNKKKTLNVYLKLLGSCGCACSWNSRILSMLHRNIKFSWNRYIRGVVNKFWA